MSATTENQVWEHTGKVLLTIGVTATISVLLWIRSEASRGVEEVGKARVEFRQIASENQERIRDNEENIRSLRVIADRTTETLDEANRLIADVNEFLREQAEWHGRAGAP